MPKYPDLNAGNVMDILKEEIGKVFVGVLKMPVCTSAQRRGESVCKVFETL